MGGTHRPLVVFLVGPTGVGKSALGLELAREFGGEILSSDSMQFYRGMDIGTAKPTAEERALVPHHLLDIVDPDEPYNVADYHRDASLAVSQVLQRGALPFVVGGSGLYVRALANELDLPIASPDDALRATLKELARHSGADALHARLRKLDPLSADRIHPRDVKKVIRAIEVCEKTGRPMSEAYASKPKPTERYDCLMFGLTCEREALYRRIEERCDRMLNSGLIAEVQRLLDAGYARELQAMQAIGYKEVAAFLCREIGFPEAVDTFKRNSRRYAKRQYTWFGAEERVQWVDVRETEALAVVRARIGEVLESRA